MVMFVLMTFAWGSFAPISLAVRATCIDNHPIFHNMLLTDPVTSVVPTQDAQTLLVLTLDSHIRLMDSSTGKLLNDFTGHVNEAYRCRACFGHAEASVVCGDENGQVWAWDLLDVCPLRSIILLYLRIPKDKSLTAKPAS